MTVHNQPFQNAAELLVLLEEAPLPAVRKRDMISAICRIAEMNGSAPATLPLDVPALRKVLAIKPAAHGISMKTYSNIRSNFVAAMTWAGVVDPLPRGLAKNDSDWAALAAAIAHDRYLSSGLATFMSWCVQNAIAPAKVDDEVVRRFAAWLEGRTLHPRPRHIIWGVPAIWKKAQKRIPHWPATALSKISYRRPSENLQWEELPVGVRVEAEAYLELRRDPDPFETHPHVPRRPLANRTLNIQRGHIQLATSLLVRQGRNPDRLGSLVEPEAVKAVLRHYHEKAGRKPSAFAVCLSQTLIDIARYGARLPDAELAVIKALAAKLPLVRAELTQKNKELLAKLESDKTRAKLLFLPDDLIEKAQAALASGKLPLVDAQIALAVSILLAAPLRQQNLVALHWTRHFHEPNGGKGPLHILVPKEETKRKVRDLTFELPDDVTRIVRWYRREILPRVGADMHGHLFVTKHGKPKDQRTVEKQLIDRISQHVEIHMTPHQFRHVAAFFYLEVHPEGFQVVSDLLGHSSPKSTLIYAGSSSRRAGRAYAEHLAAARQSVRMSACKPRRRS